MGRFTNPRDLYFGEGARHEVKNLKGKKAIIVSGGSSMRRGGFLQDVEADLKEAGMEVKLFEGVESDPSIETVMKGAAAMRDFEPDWIVAIGGGSPMDAAKAIALLCTDDLDDERLFKEPYKKPLPIVAVPTTAGTGSEVTKVSVLTNVHAGTKQSINTPFIFPVYAFADPT